MDLWCISKVLSIFWTFSKFGLEKKRRSRGHVACSPSAREVSRCGALGPGHSESSGRGSRGTAHSESSREGLSGLGSIRGVLPAGYSGTRVVLAGLPDVVYGLGTRGQVAFSATSGGSLSRGTRGQVSHSEASGEVSLAGLATHSGASGRLAAHSEASGVGSRLRHSGARVVLRRWVRKGSRNGLFRRRLLGWLSGQVSYSEGFRRGFRRRLRRGTR